MARARSGDEDVDAFRLLQHHPMDIGQRRVELVLELANLEREHGWRRSNRPLDFAAAMGNRPHEDAFIGR